MVGISECLSLREPHTDVMGYWTGEHLQALSDRGYEILSTGGTAKALLDANIAVVPVQDVTCLLYTSPSPRD